MHTDNHSLYDTINTTNLISDRRLPVETSAIGEMESQQGIETSWISSNKQMGDLLTKKDVSPFKVTNKIQEGVLKLE